MKTVIIGAGKIGCGLAGQLLHDSGHEVVFVARSQDFTEHLNRVGRYFVRLVGQGGIREMLVDGVRAVAACETEFVAEEIADADLVITSVGFDNLQLIARLIAEGIKRRTAPVNVLAFENSGSAGPSLRSFVAKYLPVDFPLDRHGFAGVLISRAVTQRLGDIAANAPLVFVGDPYSRIIVDSAGLRGPLPHVEGMIVADNYDAWVQKKFCMFSAAHATTAYLGHLKGYKYVHTAIRDPQIRAAVLTVIKEGQQGLAARYGAELAGDESDCREILERIGNAYLCDPISRVGREPCRKLKSEDRLVGTARLAEAAGVEPRGLGLAIAAAMFYTNQKDPSAFELQHQVLIMGGEETLRQFSGLDNTSKSGRLANESLYRLTDGWRRGGVITNLDKMVWA